MNKTKTVGRVVKMFLALGALFAAGSVSAAVASAGSCQSKAGSISVGGSKTVTLVNEYYGDGDFADSGVYYLKLKLSKYDSCTVKATGCDTMWVETDYEDDNAPSASFTDYEVGSSFYSVIEDGDWFDDDPTTGTFFIVVDGAIGDKVTVSVESGNSLPKGIAENPASLTVKEAKSTSNGSFNDGEYWYSAKLQGGRRYYFTTKGGTDDYPLFITTEAEVDFVVVDNGAYADDTNNTAIVVYPFDDDTFTIVVSGEGNSFSLEYYADPALPIGSHQATELNKANDYTASATPGYVNTPGSGYCDNIIDEVLFKATLEAGKNYIFETFGATTNIIVRVYDSTGKLDASKSTTSLGIDFYDALSSVAPTSTGVFYFGVAQDIDEIGVNTEDGLPEVKADIPAIKVALREVVVEEDVPTGISAIPAKTADDDPVEVDVEGAGPFVLDEGRWTQTFVIGARNGIKYKLRAVPAGDTRLSLKSEVFTKSGSKENSVTSKGGIDSPGGLTFQAKANDMYYVRVTVAEGQGWSYPEFTVHCSATSSDGKPLGILRVETKGVAAQWTINSEKVKYDAGVSILASGTVTVKFEKVSGFSQPENQTVEMEPGETKVVTGLYSDTSDPKDNTQAGASKLSISAKNGEEKRTLFYEDKVDYFSFQAKEGVYYNFALSDITGDCVFSIVHETEGEICSGETSISKLMLPASKSPYYIVVTHGGEVAVDGSYTLVHSSANVGAIKFAKTSVSVKENAPYADVAVKRTAKEGRVRVRFGTVAGTAKPGSEYCPTNGVLEWAANDNKDKTIRIKLIPDVVPVYEGDAKLFSVQLKAMEEDELEADEYPAQILTETAAVALTEVTKKTPGTISVTSYNGGDEDVVVSNAKKPAVTVTAGETLALTLSRSGGANGTVGVKVAVAKGTAVPGTDFALVSESEVVWTDGDAANKTVEIETYSDEDTGSYAETKTFTVKLSAITGSSYDKPTIAGASVAATITSDVVAIGAEAYSKGLSKADGIAIAASKKGAWFIDSDGELRCAPMSAGEKQTVTFTLTGPGFFKATPSLSETEGGAYITATVGKTDLGNVVDEDVALVIPAGSTKVVFSVNAGSKAGTGTGEDLVDVHASFAKFDMDDGSSTPYFWVPLSTMAPTAPADKAQVFADSVAALAWDGPVALEDEGEFFYRVTMDSDQKKLGTENALFVAYTHDPSAALTGENAPKMEAGKTYYWRTDYGYAADGEYASVTDWQASKTVWSFATLAAGAPVTSIASGKGVTGVDIEADSVVSLMQGVKVSFAIGCEDASDTVTYAVSSGKLPDGLKLDAKTGIVSGVPTKVGKYSALFQAKSGKVGGSTVALGFDVAAITTAVGTFNGVFAEDGSVLTNGLPAVGSVVFTAAESGKLSAKVALAGKSYTFTSDGYDEIADFSSEGDPETDFTKLGVKLTQVQKAGSVIYTNTLEIALTDAGIDNIAALGSAAGTFVLTMAVPDAKGSGVQEDVVYAGELWRDNTKLPLVLEAEKAFVGYYTLALAPSGKSEEAPQGYGYLTLTLDAKGKVKVVGALADGTKVSGSATAALVGTINGNTLSYDLELIVPFVMSKSPYCFGGELRIFLQEGDDGSLTPVLDSTVPLVWNNDNAAATYSGEEGWREVVFPVGGWYDTLVSLQAYYLNYAFLFDVAEDLPEELLTSGFSFAASCTPNGMAVDVSGDSISVDKKSLVKMEGAKSASDLENSINPWDVKVAFKRNTGIVSGSFNAWTEGFDAKGNYVQKEIKGLKHEGVLILNRDAEASLPEDVWTAGYYIVPTTLPDGKKTRKWNASLPFCIRAVDQGDIDWWADDWGE